MRRHVSQHATEQHLSVSRVPDRSQHRLVCLHYFDLSICTHAHKLILQRKTKDHKKILKKKAE